MRIEIKITEDRYTVNVSSNNKEKKYNQYWHKTGQQELVRYIEKLDSGNFLKMSIKIKNKMIEMYNSYHEANSMIAQ
jgi:hypothetical protein